MKCNNPKPVCVLDSAATKRPHSAFRLTVRVQSKWEVLDWPRARKDAVSFGIWHNHSTATDIKDLGNRSPDIGFSPVRGMYWLESVRVKSMLSKDELTSLLEEVVPRAGFYPRDCGVFRPPASKILNSGEYRTEFERVKFDAYKSRRIPTPSEFFRSEPDLDRFPEEQFGRLVALVGQLLDPYTDRDTQSFVAVLPSSRVHGDNLSNNVERFSKSIVRCATLFGVPETIDTVLRLVDGDTAKYTQVVVLDGVMPSNIQEGIDLWPGARLIEWDQAFGHRLNASTLGIPDAVLTQARKVDTNTFRFGRGNTLFCIDRTGGPIMRRSEDAEPGAGGPYVPVSPHQLSTEIAISALSLTINHPILEICSWHWYDAKVQALLGYRNELALNQNMGGPKLMRGRLMGANDAQLARDIHEGLSRQGVFEKVRVPIQRWRRSQAARNGVDLAIDLRIALESLFLDENNNAELGFRMALRAAWYLGVEGPERTAAFDALRKAYTVGSKAVHTGKGYGDMIPAELAAAQDICRVSILRRISAGGNPPNWKTVVLGH